MIKGELTFQGDKSLSHRAVILASVSSGESYITNFLYAKDTMNTLKAVEKLGVQVIGEPLQGKFKIISEGLSLFRSVEQVLDVGNSGTAARLLLGLISGCEGVNITIDGDESLKKRPMSRITSPLCNFGARFNEKNNLPITVKGTKLKPIYFEEKLGSAQVKSACILAGIASQVNITLLEKKRSRDHTEKMLQFIGVPIKESRKNGLNEICLQAPYQLKSSVFQIWGDISSAAFFIALACLIEGSELIIRNVLLNKYRTGYINILRKMGADIKFIEKNDKCGEKGGDLQVKYSPLKNISITSEDVPSIIDEIPILAIVASLSPGIFKIRGAEELRRKESDRIHALCYNLNLLGYECEEYLDGFYLLGNPNQIPQGIIHGFSDHRIIMAFEIANQVAKTRFPHKNKYISFRESKDNKKWVRTSFPEFYTKLEQVMH